MMEREHFLSCFLVCVCFSVISGASKNNIENNKAIINTDLASDLNEWMTNLPYILRTSVSIKDLAIPGSHDSFTSDITSDSEMSPDCADILKILGQLPIAKVVISNWSKTQAFNVLQQLEAGIRFFDLRICRNDKNDKLYFCHAMYSTEVNLVLQDMATYLDQHPQEIVILDCQHFHNFTSDTHDEVIQLLKDVFGTKVVPYQNDMSGLTLDYLASQRQQVFIVYRDQRQSGEYLLWPSESFPTPWYDTMDATKLFNEMDNGLLHRSQDLAFVSQCILSIQENDIINNLLSSLKQKCAVDFETNRTNWISNQTPGEDGVNVIIADFIDLSNNLFSKTVINLNLKLIEKLKDTFTTFSKIKRFMRKIRYLMF